VPTALCSEINSSPSSSAGAGPLKPIQILLPSWSGLDWLAFFLCFPSGFIRWAGHIKFANILTLRCNICAGPIVHSGQKRTIMLKISSYIYKTKRVWFIKKKYLWFVKKNKYLSIWINIFYFHWQTYLLKKNCLFFSLLFVYKFGLY